MYLEALINTLDTSFQSSEFQDLQHDEANLDDSLLALSQLLGDFSNGFYRSLNLSVISGEYVSHPSFVQNLDSLTSKLSESYLVDQDSVEDLGANRLNDLIISCFRIYKSSIDQYRYLYAQVHREFTASDGIHSFDAIKNESFSGLHPSLHAVLGLASDFRSTNIALAINDHYPVVGPDKLRQLILIREELRDRSYGSDQVFRILLDKCTFLLRKLQFRYDLNKMKYQYMVDFVERELGTEDLVQDYFGEFDRITELHYDIDSRNRIQEFSHYYHISNGKYARRESLTYSDFHCIVKYQKHANPNWNKLIEICDRFKEEAAEIAESAFNKRAREITSNYFANNKLSAKIGIPGTGIDTVLNEISEIEFLQKETKVHNYFPFLKVCNYIIKELDILFSSGKKSEYADNFETIKKLLDHLREYESLLREKFKWCKEHRFLAFQLPYEECVQEITVNEERIKVFLASSFVLPINYPIVEKEISDISTQLSAYETISKFQSSISDDLSQIKNIKETIDKTDKRHIEILSVFAAIVLFVSSNIQIFTRTETVAQALRFMLVFGYVLVLFVVLIWLITRETVFSLRKIPWIHRIILILLFAATIASFHLSSDIFTDDKSRSAIKKDSISRVYIDSLIQVRVNKALKGKK
ncbi:hypothetical protein [Dyadobacter sp. OTU695]|uniref:hypothetical protein n=1 Tax=Dyadobacter sp. OTU695 TaxID=3043860 RepID=UPI00313CE220